LAIGWALLCNQPFHAFCLLFGLFVFLSRVPIVSIISIPIFLYGLLRL
jgi:hypothetical protein